MRRIAVLIALAAISASTIPAVAAECTSNKDIDASCARRTTVQSQPADVADAEKTCRAYAASFYESVMLRQVRAMSSSLCPSHSSSASRIEVTVVAFS